MDYTHLPRAEQRAIVQARIATLEAEHYTLVIDGDQPVADPLIADGRKRELGELETRITALRGELATLA